MLQEEVSKWVEEIAENEGLAHYSIEVQGQTSNSDGYFGSVIFLTVRGNAKSGDEKNLDLVLKVSKDSAAFRKQTPIQLMFEKEIFVYEKVNLMFEKLFNESTNLMPKLYASWITGDKEALVLENMKPKGFQVRDRMQPMTFNHIKLILEAYGRWHAYSFALRRGHDQEFEKLVANQINIWPQWVVEVKLLDLLYDKFCKAREYSISSKDETAYNNLQWSKQEVKETLVDLYEEEKDCRVILHGDCWSNNFLFKNRDQSTEPVDLRIIDFQFSGLGSPVMDLSYFIYCCCQTAIYTDVNVFLQIYYLSFKANLERLGFNSEIIFNYDDLIRHWKHFSRYGLILSCYIVFFAVCDPKDAPDLAKSLDAGKEFAEIVDFESENLEQYNMKMKDNFLHYITNLKTIDLA